MRKEAALPETRRSPPPYEPPRVEQALTPAELEQEVRYAGEPTGDPG